MLVACPILPRISNFDDLDPLKLEPSVELLMVPPGKPIPPEARLIVLPGSKATIADLEAMRGEGWDIDVLAHHRRGGMVLGLCGGYQMLGRRLVDPDGVEGLPGECAGLGLLNVETVLTGGKALRPVEGRALGASFQGYEMHMGETGGPDTERPFAMFSDGRRDGAVSADGMVMGTYTHGVLADPAQRAALLGKLGVTSGGRDYHASVDAALDEIAAELETHLDIDALVAISQNAKKAER
jgi:adenosylcobyric acid synthase